MTVRRPALLLLVWLLLVACGSTSPPPTASVSPSATTASPGPAAASPGPDARDSPSPALPTATPTPDVLAPGGLAEIKAKTLKQVADPEHPRDDAFQESDNPMGRTLEPLQRASDVYLLESRVVDGREWWRVADSPFVGCCAPFGWIPATTGEGAATLGPPSTLYCPQPDGHLTAYDVIHPQWFDPAVCFGHADVTLRGYLSCTRGLTIDAAYFLTGLSSWDETGVECTIDGRFDEGLTVFGDVATSLTENREYGEFVDVTGHYFDPASSECRWTSGNYMPMSVDAAPTDTAVFACQMRFVATEITPLP